ncbi:MAG: hypothetical protein AAGK14_13560 [Verrucomicrobiota bacterium]
MRSLFFGAILFAFAAAAATGEAHRLFAAAVLLGSACAAATTGELGSFFFGAVFLALAAAAATRKLGRLGATTGRGLFFAVFRFALTAAALSAGRKGKKEAKGHNMEGQDQIFHWLECMSFSGFVKSGVVARGDLDTAGAPFARRMSSGFNSKKIKKLRSDLRWSGRSVAR